MRNSRIAATGSFIPSTRYASHELERDLSLPAGWIQRRTGVEYRAIADSADAVSDLAVRAGRSVLDRYEFNDPNPHAINTLILATSTPDHILPPSAPKIAHDLQLGSIAAFDVTVACCGFLYATILADAIVRTQDCAVLVIGANILSRRCRSTDKSTRPIFADAAGAIVLAPTDSECAVLSSDWQSDGAKWSCLTIPDGGSRNPIDEQTFATGSHLMQLDDGQSIFRYAVESMARLGSKVVVEGGISIEDVDWWVPHQANIRIIESTRRLLKIDARKTLTTLQMFGNSSAATIPVTIDYFLTDHQHRCIRSGDIVLMTAAAAGMTSAACLVRMP